MELGDEEIEGEPAADHATLEALVEAARVKSTAEEPHPPPLDFLLQPRGEPTGLALALSPPAQRGNKAELVPNWSHGSKTPQRRSRKAEGLA